MASAVHSENDWIKKVVPSVVTSESEAVDAFATDFTKVCQPRPAVKMGIICTHFGLLSSKAERYTEGKVTIATIRAKTQK